MSLDWTVQGLDDFDLRMLNLKVSLQKKIIRKAARRAMIPVRDDARIAAKALDDAETPNAIWKNIAIVPQKNPDPNTVGMMVGVRGGAQSKSGKKELGSTAGRPGGDTWYWRLVEFGTSHSAAFPFMRQSFRKNLSNVESQFADEVSTGIDEAVQ